MRRRRTPEIIAGRFDINGGIITCTDPGVTCQKTATGVYTVTCPSGFRVMGASANAWVANTFYVAISGFGERTVTFNPVNSTGNTGADQQVSFVIVGTQQ
jgi:hypothetical protein